MRTIAVGNQKGGVGKTTVAVGLAERLNTAGYRVLLVDADQQGNATERLGVDVNETMLTMADVLAIDPQTGMVVPGGLVDAVTDVGPAWRDLVDLVPANLQLGDRENDHVIGREMRLRAAMAGDELASRYDFAVIDCPPDLGQLTVNALIAADLAVCVTEARADSVGGVDRMRHIVELVARHYNPGLVLAGIAVNKYRGDVLDQQAWLAKCVGTHGELVIAPWVPQREFVAQAATAAVPLAAAPARPGARAEVSESLDAIVARVTR